MMLHTQTTRTGEVEAERSEVQGHFSATKQVQDQPGYIRHRLKQIKEKSTCGILQSVAKASHRLFCLLLSCLSNANIHLLSEQ